VDLNQLRKGDNVRKNIGRYAEGLILMTTASRAENVTVKIVGLTY
jgi:hypothetical protein